MQAVLPGRVSGSGAALCDRLWRPALLPRHRAAPASPPDGAPGSPQLPARAPGEASPGAPVSRSWGRLVGVSVTGVPALGIKAGRPHQPGQRLRAPRPSQVTRVLRMVPLPCTRRQEAMRGACLLAWGLPSVQMGWSPSCAPHIPLGETVLLLDGSVGLKSHQARCHKDTAGRWKFRESRAFWAQWLCTCSRRAQGKGRPGGRSSGGHGGQARWCQLFSRVRS